jgi:streptogramin lyase
MYIHTNKPDREMRGKQKMSRKDSAFVFVVLLLFSISIFGLQPSSAYGTAQAAPQTSLMQRQADPPYSYTRLIREYVLPDIPLSTVAYLGPRRGPCGIVYDNTGYTWVTEFNRDSVYRLTPATTLNQTTTSALEWILPTTTGRRFPTTIIVNETGKVVWFTNPASYQISRLNWSSNRLDDWNLVNLNIRPLDLVMVGSTIWFTAMNFSYFCRLDVPSNSLTLYSIRLNIAGIAPVPARPGRIATNGTSLYMTDWKYDNLYEVRLAALGNALVYPLVSNGLSWDVDVDPDENMWVTQVNTSLINEQLAHSNAKSTPQIYDEPPLSMGPVSQIINKTTISVRIEVTPVTPSVYPGPEDVIADPLYVWSVPTSVTAVTMVPPPARPWDIAASDDDYAWYTEPIYNHIDVVKPDTNETLLYSIPTAASWPVCIDVQLAQGLNPYHVWFTEYLGSKIGELFNATYADVRVCPSLPAQYPPPSPGSIRWTPGVEIWIDAPSNGYDATHHDSGERGATNHLYASVKNTGLVGVTSVSVKFYWYNSTSDLSSNYIPLPPGTPSPSKWALIGTTTISLAAGETKDVSVDWYIPSNNPAKITVGVQVSVGGDSNLYDNVGYCNFTLTTPTGAPSITLVGVGVGFAAGFVVMGVIALVTRKGKR